MEVLELILLIAAYTFTIVALFLGFICYSRKLETWETLFLTGSLLLLIVALTLTYFAAFAEAAEAVNTFLLITMILVGLATVLNTWAERRHTVAPPIQRAVVALGVVLGALVLIGYGWGFLRIMQYVVAIYLGLSVVYAMILIRKTPPHARMAHRERVERMTALACLIVLPLSLAATYFAENRGFESRIGFTFPLLFIVLAGGKIWDDMQRLSLFKPANTVKDQQLKNYGFTEREKEVIEHLVKGATYKQTAEALFISVPTVKTHVSNIYKKAGVNNKIELVALLSG